jgi:hypothetical protein
MSGIRLLSPITLRCRDPMAPCYAFDYDGFIGESRARRLDTWLCASIVTLGFYRSVWNPRSYPGGLRGNPGLVDLGLTLARVPSNN